MKRVAEKVLAILGLSGGFAALIIGGVDAGKDQLWTAPYSEAGGQEKITTNNACVISSQSESANQQVFFASCAGFF